MATARGISNLSGQQLLFSTPEIQKGKITAINVNQWGDSTRQLIVEDVFTPDISNGNPSPTTQIKTIFEATLKNQTVVSVDELSLRDIETFGEVYLVGDALDSGCSVTVNYHFEQ